MKQIKSNVYLFLYLLLFFIQEKIKQNKIQITREKHKVFPVMNCLILMMIWSTISCTITLVKQKRLFLLLLELLFHFASLFLQQYQCWSKEKNTNMFTWWMLTFSLTLLSAMKVLPPNTHSYTNRYHDFVPAKGLFRRLGRSICIHDTEIKYKILNLLTIYEF